MPHDFQPKRVEKSGNANTQELVAMLEHRHGWHRDTASRLLYERQDRSAIQPLLALAENSKFAVARMSAMYALLGLGALDTATLLRALSDSDTDARIHAIHCQITSQHLPRN